MYKIEQLIRYKYFAEKIEKNGLDPYAYLKYIFTKESNLNLGESTDCLLPWNASDCFCTKGYPLN